MPHLDMAAVSLLKLLGLLAESGEVQWAWLANPVSNSLAGIPARRDNFGQMLRALQGGDVLKTDFAQLSEEAKLVWEPLGVGPVQAGLAWTTKADDPNVVRLAIAARANPKVGDAPLTLAVVARLVSVSNTSGIGALTSELGQLFFDGTFPVPDFLQSASLHGQYGTPGQPPLTVGLTATTPQDDSRTLHYPETPTLGWDVARLATFLLQAFVAPRAAAQANDKTGTYYRFKNHLFPMLGSGGSGATIKPTPVFQAMQHEPASLDEFRQSVLNPDDLDGPVTFLWHARALISGKEDTDFIKSSYHFALHGALDGAIPGPPVNSANIPLKSLDTDPAVPGVWLGILHDGVTGDGRISLEVRLEPGPNKVVEIPLARVEDGTFGRAAITPSALAALDAYAATHGHPFDLVVAGGKKITFSKSASVWWVTLIEETVVANDVPLFATTYRLRAVLDPTKAHVGFALDTPVSGPLPIEFGTTQATPSPQVMLARLIDLLVGVIPPGAGDLVPIAQALADFVTGALEGQTPTAHGIIGAAAAVLGGSTSPAGSTLPVGQAFTVDLSPQGELTVGGEIGPLDFAEQAKIEFDDGAPAKKTMAARIGKLRASVALDLTNEQSPVTTFSIGVVDFRIALEGGAATGLLAGLLPDFKQLPGFSLTVGWDTSAGLLVSGSARIPVQQALGPLTVNTLAVDVDNSRTLVGVDLSFRLSVVTVTAHELGVEFRYDPGTITPFLHGLALSCNTGAVVLAGMFGAVSNDGHTDYVGGAVVSVADQFELSAMGGYTQVGQGQPSLFLFASLVAPLGGPPWMFVTGIAGGFGYNRALPPAGLLAEHPFLKVMRGDIQLGNSSASALAALSGAFAAQPGQHWIAAGLQFTSFGFINGKAVVVVGLGHELSLSVLGLAAFGINPVAYFEIGIEATADERQLLLVAGVSPNSYLIHPELFSLRGQFALLVRHAAPGAGDFVLSVGGYHPAYRPPEYYPAVERVGCKAVVYGFVRMSVEAFFACTPQALMAGAQLSLAAEFEGIGAGLDVYVDVFAKWEPFFLQARMGVALWFEFFGRHEIAVDLTIHSPPFGGRAVVDLELTSFVVEFGNQLNKPGAPNLAEFLTRQAGVPAKLKSGKRAELRRFNDGATAGLFRLDVAWGRPSDAQVWKSEAQEGLAAPIRVNAEFGFAVRTRLPVAESAFDKLLPPGNWIEGDVDLLLCNLDGLTSVLAVSATVEGAKVVGGKAKRLTDYFPAASFGAEPLPEAQADQGSARAAIGALEGTEAVVPLTEGIRFNYAARPVPEVVDALTGGRDEYAQGDERYPLPLGLHVGQMPAFQQPSTTLAFDYDSLQVSLARSAGRVARTQLALEAASTRTNRPLHLTASRADVQRFVAPVRSRGLTVATPPTGSVAMAPPASPARRAELFGVSLRAVAPYAPVSLRRRRLDGVARARNRRDRTITPPDGVTADQTTTLAVAPYETEQLVLGGGRTRGVRVRLAGKHWVRVICQSGTGAFVSDAYVAPGTRELALPARARRVTLLGEGPDVPVSAARSVARSIAADAPGGVGARGGEEEAAEAEAVEGAVRKVRPGKGGAGRPATAGFLSGAGAAVADESVGIEHDTVLMALGRNAFAGHGCVLEALAPLALPVRALDHAPGFAVLRGLTRGRIHFPATPGPWTLVLTVVRAAVDARSAVEEVRWLSERATLSSLMTVVGPDRTALMMTVAAERPWSLDLDLGTRWKLDGVALTGQPTRDLFDAFRASADWDLVDDRLQAAGDRTATNVTLEIGYANARSAPVR